MAGKESTALSQPYLHKTTRHNSRSIRGAVGQRTEGTDMTIEAEKMSRTCMESLNQGDLDIRLLGTQPNQEEPSGCKKGA